MPKQRIPLEFLSNWYHLIHCGDKGMTTTTTIKNSNNTPSIFSYLIYPFLFLWFVHLWLIIIYFILYFILFIKHLLGVFYYLFYNFEYFMCPSSCRLLYATPAQSTTYDIMSRIIYVFGVIHNNIYYSLGTTATILSCLQQQFSILHHPSQHINFYCIVVAIHLFIFV